MEYSVQLKKIRKEYGSLVANNDIDINVKKGSIMCIVGENGAGKSTLMNILYGLEQPTSGEIYINSKKVSFKSSRDAIKMKIGMVHQHFMLVNELSVLENIILGMEPKKGISLDYKKAKEEISNLEKQFGMQVPIETIAGELAVGLQQKTEILKILYRGAEILILDEPTAVLTPQETKELFASLKALAKDGKTIILITHHLDEVMEISDDIVVIRRGAVVGTTTAKETNTKELATFMVGSELPALHDRKEKNGKVIFECKDVNVKSKDGINLLTSLNFSIREGEILGFAGVSGNGQDELAKIVAGLMSINSGNIIFEKNDITSLKRKERMKIGISYIPEDRTRDGLCVDWSIEENSIAGFYNFGDYSNKFGFINTKSRNSIAKKIVDEFDVRTDSPKAKISSLSGGNQQKVVVGREMLHNPKLIIAAEPTRGIDIGAISFIHNNIVDLSNNGVAVLLISSDLNEIYELSDRIAVLFEGRIIAIVDPKNVSKEELGLYMAGAKEVN